MIIGVTLAVGIVFLLLGIGAIDEFLHGTNDDDYDEVR